MSFLVNPEVFRIGITNYWKSTWVNSNQNLYKITLQDDLILNKILNQLLLNPDFYRYGIAISHFSTIRKNKNLFLNVFVYDDKNFLEVYRNDYVENKFLFFEEEKNDELISWEKKTTKLSKSLISVLIWRVFEILLKRKLVKLNGSNLHLNVIRLQKDNVTPTFIVNYILYKLRQRYSLPWILRPILRDLRKKKSENKIAGFKMLYAGRFTRKQIADYSWTTLGKSSLNSFKNRVKYGAGSIKLKYGVCGLKLWIDYTDTTQYKRSKNLIYPGIIPCYYQKTEKKLKIENAFWHKKYLNNFGIFSLNKNAYEGLLRKALENHFRKNVNNVSLSLKNSKRLEIITKATKYNFYE